MSERIKNLEDLVAPNLEDGQKIVNYDVKNLTAPGENFGSLMLSVTINTKSDKTNTENKLHTVVKLVPEDPVAQEMFNIPVSFKVEVKFYTVVVPTLDKYLKEKGIEEGVDFVPKNYGSRLSLDPRSDKVDADAVLLLENIKLKGYKTGNKLEGLDLESAKVILESLAKFHTSSLALKLESPEIFEKCVKPYTWQYEEDDKYVKMIEAELKKVLKEKQISQDVSDLAVKAIKRKVTHTEREPWSTLVHMDSWVNNFMLKFEKDHPIHSVLVDFQTTDYKTPQHDLIFFIFSSLQDDVLERNVDNLLDFYYNNFISNLKRLNIDTTPFSRRSFDEELKMAANEGQYFHIVTMLPVLLEKKFVDVNFNENYRPEDTEFCMWNDKHKRRILFVIKEFSKRGWLQAKV